MNCAEKLSEPTIFFNLYTIRSQREKTMTLYHVNLLHSKFSTWLAIQNMKEGKDQESMQLSTTHTQKDSSRRAHFIIVFVKLHLQ